MSRLLRAALAVILVGGGGFFLYRGISGYFGAWEAQHRAAANWNAIAHRPAPPRKSRGERQAPNVTPPPFIPQGTVFSKIEIPKFHTSLYVVEGSDPASLKKGPGHVRGSAMPGDPGNCVIAGHRDVHFRILKDIAPGDPIYLETRAGRFCYRVKGTRVITPDHIEVMQPTPNSQLNLITCYPFYFVGHAPKRFVVNAELEPTQTAEATRAATGL